MQPFLKWPGGKRWLVSEIKDILPKDIKKYYEPFVGGGSIFFAVEPKKAVLADINSELINLYTVMRDNSEDLKERLENHQNLHSKDYYYKIRDEKYADPIDRAGRFLYLNRSCYNGMYRVNKQGNFNVPIGTKTNFVYDIEQFNAYANILKNVKFVVDDFEIVIKKARKGDLIFADPPYATSGSDNGFVNYNDKLFDWEDQKRLFKALVAARKRGVRIILTNVNCLEIVKMYSDADFKVKVVNRASNIAGKKDKRRTVEELLITSF